MFNDELLFDMDENSMEAARAFPVIWFSPSGVAIDWNGAGSRVLSKSGSERVFNLCVCSPLDNITAFTDL